MPRHTTREPSNKTRTPHHDLNPKGGNSQHKIESPRNRDLAPVKAGRNMGGRSLTGERVRNTRKDARR